MVKKEEIEKPVKKKKYVSPSTKRRNKRRLEAFLIRKGHQPAAPPTPLTPQEGGERETPLQCDICDKTFGRITGLNGHLRRNHPAIPQLDGGGSPLPTVSVSSQPEEDNNLLESPTSVSSQPEETNVPIVENYESIYTESMKAMDNAQRSAPLYMTDFERLMKEMNDKMNEEMNDFFMK